MSPGDPRQVLLRIADQLCAELGCAEGEGGPAGHPQLTRGNGISDVLTPQDELLVTAMRQALGRVAAAAGSATPGAVPEPAVRAALDGAEMVIRGELVSGNGSRLASLMPSFVFLVTLPIMEQDRALELSRRTLELIEDALGA